MSQKFQSDKKQDDQKERKNYSTTSFNETGFKKENTVRESGHQLRITETQGSHLSRGSMKQKLFRKSDNVITDESLLEDQEATEEDNPKKRMKSIPLRPSYANFLTNKMKQNKPGQMHSYVSLSS